MSRMGLEISRLRKEVGMTQKQLAKLVGVTESFIMEVEAGRRVLNADLSAKISKALRHEVGTLEIYENDEKIYRPEPDKKGGKGYRKTGPGHLERRAFRRTNARPGLRELQDGQSWGSKTASYYLQQSGRVSQGQGFHLIIEDNEMAGFRICSGDLALVLDTREIEKDAVYFIEYNGKRVIRQIRKLDNDRLLLISNKAGLKTETAFKKDVRVIGRFIRLEISL
jgi:Helix-turn-helix.